MNLYEINKKYEELLDEIMRIAELSGGEIDDSDEKALLEIEMKREEKIENTAKYIKNLSAQSGAIEAEITSLQERKTAVDKKTESLSRWLQGNLKGQPFSSGAVVISYRTSRKIQISEGAKLDDKWTDTKTKTTTTPNKKRMTDAIKAGEVIEGVELVANTKMVIK